jgi:hypothetical protein
MSERTDSTFDVDGELEWELSDQCDQVQEGWMMRGINLATRDPLYGELFRRALIVRDRLRNYALELESLANEAKALHDFEAAENREEIPDEVRGMMRAQMRDEADDSPCTVFPADTADNLQSVADALDDLFSREDFDSLKLLADLWEAHWARHHDVNEPVTE